MSLWLNFYILKRKFHLAKLYIFSKSRHHFLPNSKFFNYNYYTVQKFLPSKAN